MTARILLFLPFALLGATSTIACQGSDETPANDSPSGTDGTGARSDFGGASSGDGDGDRPSGGESSTGSGGSFPVEPPNWEVTGITTWRHDATAAYTIFHDDTCSDSVDNQFDEADPALVERGLVASFGAIAVHCVNRDLWDELETLRSHGHEVANHSYSHERLTAFSTDVEEEIDFAHQVFEENLEDFSPSYFIFPFDSFNDTLVERLRDLGYTGARAGERGLNLANFPDDLRINFDVYGPGYSIYVGNEGTPCEGVEPGDNWQTTPESCRAYVMNQYVDDIIDAGGYGIRELHSLDGEAWEPLPVSEYEEHLDYFVEKVNDGDLWVATASDAIRYRRGRDACTDTTVSADTIHFEPSDDCTKFATALTYAITPLGDASSNATATQEGNELEFEELGNGSFLLTVDPTGGPVSITP